MLSRRRVSLIAAWAIIGGGITARAQSLGIGDPAPKLEVKEFVKGEPVKRLEPGKNYVIEFWATWCAPCRATIPHLTELQKKHPDVTFIGVSVAERDPAGVKPFVQEMGDKMDYRVALDAIPEGKEGDEGAMITSWMKAAAQEGIPTAFIVNKEGKIAWIGHPIAMDKPLEKIVSGNWDLKTAAKELRKEKEEQAKLQDLASRLQAAQRAGDAKTMLAAIREIIDLRPQLGPQLGPLRLHALLRLDEQDQALDLAKQLASGPLGKIPAGLNALARAIVDPDAGTKPNKKLLQLAVDVARRADEQSDRKNGIIADTLAKAYFDSSEVAKAIETQERAIRLAEESGQFPEPLINQMKDRLEEYKKAAKAKK